MTTLKGQPQNIEVMAISEEYQRPRRTIGDFLDKNRRSLSSLLVFAILMVIFLFANPSVFFSSEIYTAVFTSLPIRIVLVIPLVFVIVSGEIDLSFVSVMLTSLWAFSATAQVGWNPFLSLLLALSVGALIGFVNGILVTYIGLPSMMVTLGMGFLLRGLVLGLTAALPISLTFLEKTPFYNLFVGQIGGIPVQMVWGVVGIVIGVLLFNYHKFGSWTSCVGDNMESSSEMGINVRRTKILAYVYLGIGAAFASILSGMVYKTFWPRSGDPGELLLAVLASVFVGGTPTWGGVGTVPGAVIGAFCIRFIETGVIEIGLTGFWTQFFNGLIILLALAGHKLHEPRYRY